jgi:methylenetetrahydrofolate dehydrogenase (NADP+) / methenyltetrahydrofolate cyclohydrolase
MERIEPDKDVDGFHPVNVGRMLMGAPGILPCTPHGIQELLIRSGNSPEGKHVVVVGRSNIVGKPIAAILMQKAKNANATVTICHSGTKDLPQFTKQADILITAMGRPQLVRADMVKDGVIVIDVGMNRIDDPKSQKGYRLVGDVDYDPVSKKAKAITPVPGGVGPMTRAMLMVNTVRAAEIAFEKAQAKKR